MSLPVIETLPKGSQEAIVEFDARYLTALNSAPPPSWRNLIGPTIDVTSPEVRFPLSLIGARYRRFEGSNRFKTMLEKYATVKVEEMDAGYEAKLMDLETNVFAYKRWQEAPGRLIQAEDVAGTRLVLTLLQEGVSTVGYDEQFFFDTDHPSNPFDDSASLPSWSNLQTTPKTPTDIDDLTEEVIAMQGVRDENGDELGLDPDTIFVGTALYQPTVNFLAQQDLISNGAGAGLAVTVRNPYMGKFNVVHVPNWAGLDWMLFDSKLAKAQGLDPFTVARFRPSAALSARWFDEASDYFKNTGKIAFSSHIWLGAALLFPHTLRLIKGA